MKSKTKFIGIGAQKGGVGKSSITTLLAGYLYYTQGYNLGVIDCDYPQHSVLGLRQRDRQELEANPQKMEAATNHFKQLGRKSYPIIAATAETAILEAEKLIQLSSDPLDIIFFDLPGSIDVPGVLALSLELDYIFSPIFPDMQTLESALNYVQLLRDYGVMRTDMPLKKVCLFWNRVDGREKTALIDLYNQFLREEGFVVLATFLPNSVRFNKEATHNDGAVFRSTYYPPDKRLLKGSNIEELAFEITQIINE